MRKYFKVIFFILLFWYAVVAAQNIALPFSNPAEISGPLTAMRVNPINNTVRFLCIIFFPTVVYLALYTLSTGFLKKNRSSYDICDEKHELREKNDLALDRKIKKRDKIVLFVFFATLLFVYLGFSTFNNKPLDTFHDGESLGPAVDYLKGKTPYLDTIMVHGLFQDSMRSAIAFELFGKSISSYRLFTSILEIVAFLLFFATLFFLFNKKLVYGAFLGTILFLLLDVGYNITFRDIITYFFIIIVCLFYYEFINISSKKTPKERGRSRAFYVLSFLTFFIPIASFANSIDRGIYSFVSVVFLFFLTLLSLREKKDVYAYAISAISGFIGGVVLLGIVFKGGLKDFVYFTFVAMPSFKELLDAFVYEFQGRNLIPVIVFSAVIFWLSNRLVLFISEKDMPLIERMRNFARSHFLELFLLVLSLIFFKGALGRCDIGHILYVSWPLFTLLAYILIRHNFGLGMDDNKLFYSLTFIVLLAVSLATLYKHDPFDAKKNWWKFSNDVKDEQFMPENQKKTIEFLKKNLKKDEYFYSLTSEGTWYYFIDRPCPTRFPSTVLATPNFYQKEVVRDLGEKGDKVKYIIFRNNLWTNNLDFIPNEKRYPYLIEYIKENYEFYKLIDDQEIWKIRKK